MTRFTAKILMLASILTSCDCIINVDGRVISSSTKLPIANASIELIERGVKSVSDENGVFNIGEHTGFCYPVELEIKFKNHKPFRIILERDSDGDCYKLIREFEFVEYDKPFYPNPKNKDTFITGTWVNKYSVDFEIKSDSIIVYLDEENIEKEINTIREKLKKKSVAFNS